MLCSASGSISGCEGSVGQIAFAGGASTLGAAVVAPAAAASSSDDCWAWGTETVRSGVTDATAGFARSRATSAADMVAAKPLTSV